MHFYNAFFASFSQVLIHKKVMGSPNNTIINVTEQKKIGDIFNPSDSFQTNKKMLNIMHVCLDVKVAIYFKKSTFLHTLGRIIFDFIEAYRCWLAFLSFCSL